MKTVDTTAVQTRKTNGPMLQRKCACGQHTIAGQQCEACRKSGITVAEADDLFEREADSMASKITGSQGAGSASAPSPPPAVTPQLESRLRSMIGRGRRLADAERRLFEPRFGHDFSQVRIHTGDDAAELSSKLDAEAFTFGQDIFFNQGRYNPGQPAGRHLLAHELTHVMQQNSGAIARHQLRRAKIPYRALTWADFKATPPAGSPFAAETSSGFPIPGWSAKRDPTPTGKDCTIDKKADKEYKVTVTVPTDAFDSLAALMDQDQSWVKPRHKDPSGFCSGTKATECQKDFDAQTAQAAAGCDTHKKKCEDFFKANKGTYTVTVNGTDIDATSSSECATLVAKCKTESAKAFEFTLQDVSGTDYATAKTKKDCTDKPFQEACVKHETADSTRLLKHEQGHFDISNVLAGKAKKDLKAKAATFSSNATACGSVQANNAAVEKFKASGAIDTLKQRGDDWGAKNDEAQRDYDNDTDHGLKIPEQAAWEAKIAAGLTAYDLNPAPAAPANTTPGANTNPPPATPPTNTPPANPPANPGLVSGDGLTLQRQCACGQNAAEGECEECRRKREQTLQRDADGHWRGAQPHEVRQALSAAGEPLDPGTRRFMESRFGYDFSAVRIHANSPSAPAVNARAYTVGSDVVFAPGRYAPTQPEGRRLIAHELAHVIQQSRGVRDTGVDPDASLEREAKRAGEAINGTEPVAVTGASGGGLAKDGDAPPLLPPLSPSELLNFMLTQRGFGSSAPGPAPIDPRGVGEPMGKGFETYAAIQILTKEGKQVRVGVGAYLGGGQAHGEAQAVAALRAGLPKGVDLTGGSMMVAVEKVPCGGCAGAIEQLAQDLGLREYTVYVPDRASMTDATKSVTAKQASRTVFQGGRPPTSPRQVTNRQLPPQEGPEGGGGGRPRGGGPAPAAPAAPRTATPAPPKAAGSGAASALSDEARAAARSAAASIADDFKILRAAKFLTTATHVLQFISALQTLDEFMNMANNALANKGFILTKEIAESQGLENEAAALAKDYPAMSQKIGSSSFRLMAAGADPTTAGRAASAISDILTQLGSVASDLSERIARIDAAEKEASLKQRACEKILEDPKANAALTIATFGSPVEQAKLFAASQDFQAISGHLRSASNTLKSVRDSVAADTQFLDAWFDVLFAKCKSGGICSEGDIQIPFIGTSHWRLLPGSEEANP